MRWVPYIIGKSCVEHGGFVKGFSPATDSYEHKNSYKHPLDGCSIIEYLNSESKNLTSRFLMRSIPLIEEANIIVSIAGNWGTLNELTVGIITGKKLIILMDSGGISSTFYELYHGLLSEYDYNYGESVDFVESIEDLWLYLLKNN